MLKVTTTDRVQQSVHAANVVEGGGESTPQTGQNGQKVLKQKRENAQVSPTPEDIAFCIKYEQEARARKQRQGRPAGEAALLCAFL